MIVKDGTLLLEGTKESMNQIFGELRDIYDGQLAVDYRNGRSADFKGIHFSQIMGMTEAIYGINTSMLGERFIHVRLEVTREQELSRSRAAAKHVLTGSRPALTDDNQEGDSRSFPKQRQATAGFLQHLHSKIRDADGILTPNFTDEDIDRLQAMADVIACCRAINENELFDTRPEASTRVVKQLARLALCLCYVLDTTSVSGEVMRLVSKVCLDSCHGQQFRVRNILAKNRAGVKRQALAVLSDIPLETLTRRMKSMERMGLILLVDEDERIGRGRKNKVVKLPDWIAEAFETVHGVTNARTLPPIRKAPSGAVGIKPTTSVRKRPTSPPPDRSGTGKGETKPLRRPTSPRPRP
jgi:hypothetical protein